MTTIKTYVVLLVLLIASSTDTYGQSSKTGFDETAWTVLSERGEVSAFPGTQYRDKVSLELDGANQAIAWTKEVDYRNFSMELFIASESMAGIGFRVADAQNYHFIYFRPAYGGTQEAIQYVPVYNGALSWVFYNNPTYGTAADIKSLEWFHVNIVVNGDNLQVYVDDMTKPQLDIPLAETKMSKGSILLRSMFGVSYFADVGIHEIPEVQKLNAWEISEQLPRNMAYDYEHINEVKTWKKISNTDGNYINLGQHYEHPNGVIFARHKIHADTEQRRLLNFDFAGKLQVILNGKEIFHYTKYKLDRVFGDGYATMLNLKKGTNELVFISEGDAFLFGEGFNSMGRTQHQNWGFVAKLEPS